MVPVGRHEDLVKEENSAKACPSIGGDGYQCGLLRGHVGDHHNGLDVTWKSLKDLAAGEKCKAVLGRDGMPQLQCALPAGHKGGHSDGNTAWVLYEPTAAMCQNISPSGRRCIHAPGHDGKHGNGLGFTWKNIGDDAFAKDKEEEGSVDADEADNRAAAVGKCGHPLKRGSGVATHYCTLQRFHEGRHSDGVLQWLTTEQCRSPILLSDLTTWLYCEMLAGHSGKHQVGGKLWENDDEPPAPPAGLPTSGGGDEHRLPGSVADAL